MRKRRKRVRTRRRMEKRSGTRGGGIGASNGAALNLFCIYKHEDFFSCLKRRIKSSREAGLRLKQFQLLSWATAPAVPLP